MPTYPTYDNLRDLTPEEMKSARPLTLTKSTKPIPPYDNEALFATTENYALLRDTFSFYGTKGATYDVLSSSYFDPILLKIYDNLGNTIAVDDGQGSYGYDHASFIAPYSGIYYVSASWDQGSYFKTVGLGIWEDIDTIPPKAINNISGTNGNDVLIGTEANDIVNAAGGMDTFVVAGARSQYSYSGNGVAITLLEKADPKAADTLQGVERIKFADVTVSFETTGAAAEAYRLYQAAFGRTPDKQGLGYWVVAMSNGVSRQDVATEFVKSAEFIKLYAADPSNKGILTGVYQNVLHRAPDQAGFDWWLKALDSKAVSVSEMLAAFSESPENQAQVVGTLISGFEFSNL